MPELDFTVERAEPLAFAAQPTVVLKLGITARDDVAVRSVSLAVQVRIAATRRAYAPAEQERLLDIFGEPARWGQTLKSLLWTMTSVQVPGFRGQTLVDLAIPCTYDFEVVSAKYFDALQDGHVPLELLFSGTVFYVGDGGGLPGGAHRLGQRGALLTARASMEGAHWTVFSEQRLAAPAQGHVRPAASVPGAQRPADLGGRRATIPCSRPSFSYRACLFCSPTSSSSWRIGGWSHGVMRPDARGLAVAILGLLVAAALSAPLIAPYDPALPVGLPLKPPGPDHLLGTNDLGQDVWSQWLWGSRASLLIAVVVTLLSTGLSWTIGLTAGLWRSGEAVLMGLTDLLLALPAIPLYLLVVALIGPSQVHLMLALGLLSWPARADGTFRHLRRGDAGVSGARRSGGSQLGHHAELGVQRPARRRQWLVDLVGPSARAGDRRRGSEHDVAVYRRRS